MSLEDWRDFVERVREGVSLYDVVSEDTKFENNGFACCPLHQERTPSFHLRDNGERYHCFGCGADGDLFSYVVTRDRCSFRDAVEKLGKRVGITWEHGKSAFEDPDVQAELMRAWDSVATQDIHDRAARFMHYYMPSKVREWVKKQWHFDDDTLKDRMIGWGNEQLYFYLHDDLGYDDKTLLKSGLFVRTREGIKTFFDNRVVLPYYKGGHVRYFIGRRTPWSSDEPHEKGKYKKLLTHSDKHDYVSKLVENHWFYNEDDARGQVERLIITEGITDAISLSMIGERNISPVTTRFSNKELERAAELCRNIPRVIICNDADVLDDGRQPGLEGALSTARYLYEQGIHAWIAELPRPSDTNKLDLNQFIGEAIDEGGVELARKKVNDIWAKAKPYIEWSVDSVPRELSATDLNEQLAPVFDMVARREPIERERYCQQISKRFKLSRATVGRQIDNRVREAERIAAGEAKDEEQERRRRRNTENDKIRGQVYQDLGFYYVLDRNDNVEVISSFAITPKQLIRYENNQFLVDAVIHTEGGNEYDHKFAHRAWTSKRDFVRDLNHPALQWKGSDDNVQDVLRLLKVEELVQHEGTSNLGLYISDNRVRWVTRDLVFGPEGPVDQNEITFVDTGSPMADRLRYEFPTHDEEVALAKMILPALLEINEPEVVLPTLAWFLASIQKLLIENEIGHFPVLFFNGTQGSGKTTLLRDVFWPLLGVVRPRDPFSVTDTHFATVRNLSSTNSIPVLFDEYKPGDMSQMHLDRIHRTIRRVYGGEMEVRGRSDQSIEKYRLSAPMVVAGESRPEGDPAILERIISVTPAKTSLTTERQDALATIVRNDHWKIAGPLIRFIMGRNFQSDWAKAKTLTDELLARIEHKRRVPLRCYDNLRVMVHGIRLFEAYAEHLGVELPEIDYVAAFRRVVASVLEGDGEVKDAFDRFLEAVSTYAHLGMLEAGKHYDVDVEEPHHLYLHLSACHAVYLIERRRAGQVDETNGLRALRQIITEKQVHEDAYVLGLKRWPLGDVQPRCVKIDQSRVPSTLDFTALNPKKESRRYTPDDAVRDWTN